MLARRFVTPWMIVLVVFVMAGPACRKSSESNAASADAGQSAKTSKSTEAASATEKSSPDETQPEDASTPLNGKAASASPAPPQATKPPAREGKPDPKEVAAPTDAPDEATETPIDESAEAESSAVESGAETLASVREKIIERWNAVRSFTAKIRILLAQGPPTMRITLDGKGTYDCLQKDGKIFVRMETDETLLSRNEDQGDSETHMHIVRLLDGNYVYEIRTVDDETKARKDYIDPNSILQLGGEPVFRLIERNFVLSLLSPKVIEGRPVYSIQATAHNGEKAAVYYFDQETGVMLKMKMAAGNAERGIEIHDIEFGVDFPPDHFKFEPSEDVMLYDNVALNPTGEGESSPAEADEASSADEGEASSAEEPHTP